MVAWMQWNADEEASDLSEHSNSDYDRMPLDVSYRAPHSEVRILPVKKRNEFLSRPFLLVSFAEITPADICLERNRLLGTSRGHPSITSTTLDSTSITLRTQQTSDKHWPPFTVEPSTPSPTPLNGVLGVKPPHIADEELELPRKTRVTLAQFRSGYCSRLNSYLSRIDPDIPNICPH